jgi:hypothetical protein
MSPTAVFFSFMFCICIANFTSYENFMVHKKYFDINDYSDKFIYVIVLGIFVMSIETETKNYTYKFPLGCNTIEVLKKSGRLLGLLKNPKHEEIITALATDGMAIRFVKNQTREYCMLALKENPLAIKFIKDQTDEFQWYAVSHKIKTIKNCINPSFNLVLYALKKNIPITDFKFIRGADPMLRGADPMLRGADCGSTKYNAIFEDMMSAIYFEAIKQNSSNISFIPREFFTQSMRDYIIQNHPWYISKIPNITTEEMLRIVKAGNDLRFEIFGKTWTEEIYYEFIKHHPNELHKCCIKSKRIIDIALKKDVSQFLCVEQTPKICMEYLESFPEIFIFIKVKTREIYEFAIKQNIKNLYYLSPITKNILEYSYELYPDQKIKIDKLVEKNKDGNHVYDINGNLVNYHPYFGINFVRIVGGDNLLTYST